MHPWRVARSCSRLQRSGLDGPPELIACGKKEYLGSPRVELELGRKASNMTDRWRPAAVDPHRCTYCPHTHQDIETDLPELWTGPGCAPRGPKV